MKFGRSYRITIDPNDGGPAIVVTMPMTAQFTLQRDTQASLNSLNIDLYNLSERNRNRIFQDRFVPRNRKLIFEAGYDTLSTIFKGYIFEANSARAGTDIITSITCLDGSYEVSTTMTFETFTKGKTLGDVFRFLIGQFPELELGAVGEYNDVLHRPVVLNGNTYDLLKKYAPEGVFIDMGKVYVLRQNEVIDGELPLISNATGLLDTPKRDDAYLTVTTLFEPRITMSQHVELQSSVMPVYNGVYKVLGVLHQGVISGAVGGRCRSTFKLFTGTQLFGEFKTVG